MAGDLDLLLSGLTSSDPAAARAAFEAGHRTIATVELLEPPPPPPPPPKRKPTKRNKHDEHDEHRRRTLRTKETSSLGERFWAAALYVGVHRHFDETAASFTQRGPAGDSTLKSKLGHIHRLLGYWGDDFWAELTQGGITLPIEPSKNFVDQLVVIASEQSLPEFAHSLLEFLPTFTTRYHKKTRALQDGSLAITVTVLKQYREWINRPRLMVRLPIQVPSALLERTPKASRPAAERARGTSVEADQSPTPSPRPSIERARRTSAVTADESSTPTPSLPNNVSSVPPSSPPSPDGRGNSLDLLSDPADICGGVSPDLDDFGGPDFIQDGYNTFDSVNEAQTTFEMQAVVGADNGRAPTSQSVQSTRTERSATPESLISTSSDDSITLDADSLVRLGREGVDLLSAHLHAATPVDKRVEDARAAARKAWIAADQARLTLRAARDDARNMFDHDRRPQKKDVEEMLSQTDTKLQTAEKLAAALATLGEGVDHDLVDPDILDALHEDHDNKVHEQEKTREACEELLGKFDGAEEAREERQKVYAKYHKVKEWADGVYDAVQKMRGRGAKRKFGEMLGRLQEHGGEGLLRCDSEETGSG